MAQCAAWAELKKQHKLTAEAWIEEQDILKDKRRKATEIAY